MNPTNTSASAQPPQVSSQSTLASGTYSCEVRWLFISLGIYFGLQILTRSLVSNSLQRDEAEQMLLTQDWSWGYGSQPPLYTWMQKILIGGFGINVFALSLLKNVLLFGIYGFVFLSAREILREPKPAALAAAALLLFPNLAWESQRDQTHLVLATVISAATLFAFLRLLKADTVAWYAALGALIGLGALSKYNYLFLPASLILATISIPKFRPFLFTWKSLLAFAIAATVALPHVDWFLHHKALAFSRSYRFEIGPSHSGMGVYVQGLLRFLTVTCVFLAVPILIYSPLLYRAFQMRRNRPGLDETELFLRLLLRAMLFGLVLSVVLVLAFRVTFIAVRWMQPLLFAVSILLVGWSRSQLKRGWAKIHFILSGASALAVLIAINGTVLGTNLLHRAHNLNIPYQAISGELRKAGFQKGTIIAATLPLGGSLKMQFRESRVIVPAVPRDVPLPNGPKLVVWRANPGDDSPGRFLEFASDLCGVTLDGTAVRYIEVPSSNGRQYSERLGLMLFADAQN